MNDDNAPKFLRGPDLQVFLTTLSLDCSQGLWRDTGLNFSAPDRHKIANGARHALEQLESGADVYAIDYSDARAEPIWRALVTNLTANLPPGSLDQIVDWASRLLAARNERDWYQGLLACLELLNDPIRGHSAIAMTSDDRNNLLDLITKVLRDPPNNQAARQLETPKSDYDRKAFSRYGETGAPTGALSQLYLRQHYDLLLRRVASTLTKSGKNAFGAWLTRRIDEQNAAAIP